jgi:hypothetical protein
MRPWYAYETRTFQKEYVDARKGHVSLKVFSGIRVLLFEETVMGGIFVERSRDRII